VANFYHLELIEAQEKYGPIVRTGPWHVSVVDSIEIPRVLGVHIKMFKVIIRTFGPTIFSALGLSLFLTIIYRENSMMFLASTRKAH
jgi:hypothetical protein